MCDDVRRVEWCKNYDVSVNNGSGRLWKAQYESVGLLKTLSGLVQRIRLEYLNKSLRIHQLELHIY